MSTNQEELEKLTVDVEQSPYALSDRSSSAEDVLAVCLYSNIPCTICHVLLPDEGQSFYVTSCDHDTP